MSDEKQENSARKIRQNQEELSAKFHCCYRQAAQKQVQKIWKNDNEAIHSSDYQANGCAAQAQVIYLGKKLRKDQRLDGDYSARINV